MATGASACAAILTLARCTFAFIGSPRLSNAFPPRATTMRMASVSQRRYQQRFDGVQSVLSLFERDVHLGFEDFICYLYSIGHPVGFCDLFAEGSFGVLKRWQAMHETNLWIATSLHQLHVRLVRCEQIDSLFPDFLWLAHRYPDVSVNEVDALHGGFLVIGDRQLPPVLGLKRTRDLLILIRGPKGLGTTDADVHPHQAACDHQ